MTDVTLDDRGRLTLPREVRERYGERYHLVQLHDGIKLVTVSEDPLAGLRDEFADVVGSVEDLREGGREEALDQAGR